jgi:hypothetical protein
VKNFIWVAVALLGLVNVACDDPPAGVSLINSASSIDASGRFSPNPIALSPLTPCFGGSVFSTSVDFIVTAGVQDLTLDSVTVHLLDGSNVGGSSVRIPATEFAAGTATTLIRAGTTRDFSLRPTFACFAGRPFFMRGSALLFDSQRIPHTVAVAGRVQ